MIFDPKPVTGQWNGSGAHTNFSTKDTRAEGGLEFIKKDHIPKLEDKHLEHMLVYGEGNKARLLGSYETSNYHSFGFGTGSRVDSIRLPVTTV